MSVLRPATLRNCKVASHSVLLIYVMLMLSLGSAFKLCRFPNRVSSRAFSHVSVASSRRDYSEIAVYGGAEESMKEALKLLAAKRPHLEVFYQPNVDDMKHDGIIWSAHSNNLQTDCTILEPMFLGSNMLSKEETVEKWDEILRQRSHLSASSISDEDSKSKIIAQRFDPNVDVSIP